MRIAMVTEYFEQTPGGVASYVRCLTSMLQTAGNEVVVLSRDIVQGSQDQGRIRLRKRRRLAVAKEVLTELSRLRPEVVHVHGPWYLVLGAVAYSWRRRGIGVVATQHTIPAERYPLAKRIIESYLFRRCDAVGAPSEATLVALRTVAGVGLPSDRVCLGAGPGIVYREGIGKVPRAANKLVGTCSILIYPEKIAGILDVIGAIAIIREFDPAIRLLIVGGSPSGRGEFLVRQAALSAGVTNEVILKGTVDEPWELLRGADVYVHASHRESLGMSILEAMANGIPVIAAKVGGVPEIIRDGENGLLYPPGDVRRLSELILVVLGDRGLARRLCAEGKRTVKRRYNWERVARAHMDLYERVLQRARVGVEVHESLSRNG